MSMSRMGWFAFGLFLIFIGILQYSEKGWSISRGAPTHHTLGYVYFIVGVIFCFFAILRKEFPKDSKNNHVICVSCLLATYGKELIGGKCPKCGSKVEDLKGFFDRHPELKNKKIKHNQRFHSRPG